MSTALLSRSFKIAVLGIAALAPALLGGCDRQSAGEAQPQASGSAAPGGVAALKGRLDRSRKGEPLPDFTLTNAAGDAVSLRSFKGKPLLVNLWATWCAPCVVELPMLDDLAEARAAQLKVLTVSQDMQQTEKVAPFLTERGFTHLEPWLDPKNDLAFKYEVGTLPTTILYDKAGKEVWRYVGGHDWSSKETAAMLAEGLN